MEQRWPPTRVHAEASTTPDARSYVALDSPTLTSGTHNVSSCLLTASDLAREMNVERRDLKFLGYLAVATARHYRADFAAQARELHRDMPLSSLVLCIDEQAGLPTIRLELLSEFVVRCDDGDGEKEQDVRKMVERVKAGPESTTLASFRFVVGDKFQTALVTTEESLWKEV